MSKENILSDETSNEKIDEIKRIKRMETICILQWVISFLFVPPICLLVFILSFWTSYWWIFALYFIYYMVDRHTPQKGGRSMMSARKWKMWTYMANYFPTKLIKTTDLDPDYNYIVGFHPHGVLAIGSFINFATEGTQFSKVFPGITSHLSVLTGHFDFPFYRDYLMLAGVIGVTKRSLEYVLSGIKGRGNLVCLVVGGAQEALDAHPGKYRVHLTKKGGFIKVALRTGARLIPCVSFNETRLYNQVPNPPGSLVRMIQNLMTRFFGFSPPLFYAHGIIPYRAPIVTVVGEPLIIEQIRDPSSSDIEAVKQRYIEALRVLFDTYKPQYDPDGENMEVV